MRSVLCIVAVFVLLFGWAMLDAWLTRSAVPAAGVDTFAEFESMMPPPSYMRVVQFGNGEYLAVRTEPPSLWTLPSGPPVYVFDRSGTMVDWTRDSGDDGDFQRRWLSAPTVAEVTREEAQSWLSATAVKL